MTDAKQITLSETPHGRMILHLLCANKDHKIKYHLRGIVRELRKKQL